MFGLQEFDASEEIDVSAEDELDPREKPKYDSILYCKLSYIILMQLVNTP